MSAVSFGLGDFAFLLEDGAIPIRPSLLASNEEDEAQYAHMIRKHVSPSKEKKAWKFGRQKFPRIVRKKIAGEELKELDCGCKCEDCVNNFKAYWEEKSFSKELEHALKQERLSTAGVIDDVSKMEKELKEDVARARTETDALQDKVQLLESTLEAERKLRADEVYRRQIVNEETKIVEKETNKLEKQLVMYADELRVLISENNTLRDSVTNAFALKDKALGKILEYEERINRTEKENSELKVRMYEIDLRSTKLQHKNDTLKERLYEAEQALRFKNKTYGEARPMSMTTNELTMHRRGGNSQLISRAMQPVEPYARTAQGHSAASRFQGESKLSAILSSSVQKGR